MQIKEMANFIMYVLLVEFVFSDTCSYMYFDLNLNAIIIILHDEAIYNNNNNNILFRQIKHIHIKHTYTITIYIKISYKYCKLD